MSSRTRSDPRALRFAVLLAMAVLATGPKATAQTAGPFVTGHVGLSAGDGGAAPAFGGSVGYWTATRLGFELELAATPTMDFGDLGLARRLAESSNTIPGFTNPLDFQVDASGRMLTFMSNALLDLGGTHLHAVVLGGGGVANLQQDVTYRYQQIVFPDLAALSTYTGLEYEPVEQRLSHSSNALALNAGGIVEYRRPAGLGIGADVRYVHTFFSETPQHLVRVVGRLTWRF